MKPKNILRPALITLSILLIPFIAMQFTSEVNWTFFDFIAIGILLFSAGITYEFFASRSGSLAFKGATALAVGTCLILTWINLAVGIIGNENNPINLLYFAIPMILFIGAIRARFNAEALGRTVFVGAFALALIPIIALVINRPSIGTQEELFGILSVLVLNAFFVILLVGSGLLFKNASLESRA